MRFSTILLFLLVGCGRVWAQGENNNWAFNFLYGLTFTPAGPAFIPTSMRHMGGSCSTISDANGRLLFYTNGSTVWDSQHNLMPNACSTCDGATAQLDGTSGAEHNTLIVKRPGSTSLYYIFNTDTQRNLLNGGLTYSEVDMSLRGGLGGVTAVRNVRLPTPTLSGKITEGVVGMQHTNRRDVWVVVHGLGNSVFYSFLVTGAGVSPAPIASTSGSYSTNLSTMKFAPDGRHLVRCGLYAPVELFDFDGATGLITNGQVIDNNVVSFVTGIHDFEFSADATKLYQSQAIIPSPSASFLYQYDLQAGSAAAISASKLLIYKSAITDSPFLPVTALEIGPDGRIYTTSAPYIGIIDRPNRRGSAVNYRPIGLPPTYVNNIMGISTNALQNIVRLQPPNLDFMAETACAGSTVYFAPYEIPTGTGPLTWTFFDPRTGLADSVQGPSASHTYPTAGTFSVTLSTTSRGQYYRLQRALIISPLPVVTFPFRTVALCSGTTVLQLPAQPAGTTVRWSDGSAGPQLTVSKPGKYWTEARNYQGCVSSDTVAVTACILPNIITPNGDRQNETFRIEGLRAGQWDLEIYNRWGRLVYRKNGYDNSWNAEDQIDGLYYYLLRNPASGQQFKGYVEVRK